MVVAIVFGSTDERAGFPGRNTFPLIGRSTMVYPVMAAQRSRHVEHVFVSTDAESIAHVAEGLKVPIIRRAPQPAANRASLEQAIVDGCAEVTRRLGERPEAIVVLLCNAPTVTADMIDKAVEILWSDPSWDAVASVSSHNEFAPQHALRLGAKHRLEPIVFAIEFAGEVFFSDALLWVLRSERYFGDDASRLPDRWLVNFDRRNVAPLVHEGYGDIDHLWQVPAVEEWLRRRGFTEESVPYESSSRTAAISPPAAAMAPSLTARERRVLITTVPFGDPHREPLDLLEQDGIAYTINPIGRRLKEHELAELAAEFGVLIAGTEPITARVMDAARHLRLISRVGIGLDNVDLLAARERKIAVSYTPDAPSPAVAELTLGLVLSLLRHISAADRGMRSGAWRRLMGRRLDGMTVGVVGVGRVGKRLIRLLRGGFPGVRLLANDIAPDLEFGHTHSVRWVTKDVLFTESDIVTLHVPMTPLTNRMVTTRQLGQMKRSAILVNTGRGGLVEEAALVEALRSETIRGAAIDVYDQEPYSGELTTLESCLMTCHMGSMSEDCRAQMELEATQEALRFLRGEPLLRLVPEFEYPMAMGAAHQGEA